MRCHLSWDLNESLSRKDIWDKNTQVEVLEIGNALVEFQDYSGANEPGAKYATMWYKIWEVLKLSVVKKLFIWSFVIVNFVRS